MLTGTLSSICYKPLPTPRGSSQFVRAIVSRAVLVAGYGIAGDRKGGHPTRQVNIMSTSALEGLRHAGYNVTPGALGEQLVVTLPDIETLPPGTRLHIGATAVLEITQQRDGCPRLEQMQAGSQCPGGTQQTSAGKLGVLARVLAGGEIQLGDPVWVGNLHGVQQKENADVGVRHL